MATGAESTSVAESIRQYRRALWRDMVQSTLWGRSEFEISSLQLMTLVVLEDAESLSVKSIAGRLGRSVSAVSRMIDDMVARGWVSRREDERDRRAKSVSVAAAGRELLASLEARRVDVELALIDELSPHEQEQVARAMHLLAEAARRHDDVQRRSRRAQPARGEA